METYSRTHMDLKVFHARPPFLLEVNHWFTVGTAASAAHEIEGSNLSYM